MTKIYSLLILASLLFSSGSLQAESLFERFAEINKCWLAQSDIPQELHDVPAVNNDRAAIKLHLFYVHQVLSNRDVSHLSETEQANRAAHLDELYRYMLSEAYPQNDSHNYRLPIFIDPQDNFCAVGHLIKASGNEEISRLIASETNFAYVEEMDHPELFAWASGSGLTVDELKWIQPTYGPPTDFVNMKDGTNGTVHATCYDENSNILYAGGQFNAAGGYSNINNVTMWIPGFAGFDWAYLGSGTNGPVYAIELDGGEVIAGGDFTLAGNVSASNIAKWNGISWESMGSLSGGTVRTLAWYDGDLYAGGDFFELNNPSTFANLARWNGQFWEPVGGSTNGPVNDLTVHDGKLIIGGDFTIAGSFACENIAAWDGQTFSPVGSGLHGEIYAVESFENAIYAGGDFLVNGDTLGLQKFENGSWSFNLNYLANTTIDDMAIYTLDATPTHLFLGGDFYLNSGPFGTYGVNLASVNSYGYWVGEGHMSDDVNSITISNNGYIYVGGAFAQAAANDMNHITYRYAPYITGVDAVEQETTFDVYPNPSSTFTNVNFEGTQQVTQIRLYDLTGKEVAAEQVIGNQHRLDLQSYANGVYLVQAFAGNDLVSAGKLVVQR